MLRAQPVLEVVEVGLALEVVEVGLALEVVEAGLALYVNNSRSIKT